MLLNAGAHIGPEPTTDRFVVVMVNPHLNMKSLAISILHIFYVILLPDLKVGELTVNKQKSRIMD